MIAIVTGIDPIPVTSTSEVEVQKSIKVEKSSPTCQFLSIRRIFLGTPPNVFFLTSHYLDLSLSLAKGNGITMTGLDSYKLSLVMG